jgi:uncharacterized protein (TIGR02246 family)
MPDEEAAVRALYHDLLTAWNSRDGQAFGAYFVEDGGIVGYDGSLVDGREAIAAEMSRIFTHHQTPAYVQKVRSVRFLEAQVALLRGIVGMPSLLDGSIMPNLNAIQTLLAEKHDGVWRVVLFQNTPAQFHGRPDLVQQMTEELEQQQQQ